MKHMAIDMPIVAEYLASECTDNVGMNCHAKAITVGNSLHAGCDTFFRVPATPGRPPGRRGSAPANPPAARSTRIWSA
jgi:hypothetical protein